MLLLLSSYLSADSLFSCHQRQQQNNHPHRYAVHTTVDGGLDGCLLLLLQFNPPPPLPPSSSVITITRHTPTQTLANALSLLLLFGRCILQFIPSFHPSIHLCTESPSCRYCPYDNNDLLISSVKQVLLLLLLLLRILMPGILPLRLHFVGQFSQAHWIWIRRWGSNF